MKWNTWDASNRVASMHGMRGWFPTCRPPAWYQTTKASALRTHLLQAEAGLAAAQQRGAQHSVGVHGVRLQEHIAIRTAVATQQGGAQHSVNRASMQARGAASVLVSWPAGSRPTRAQQTNKLPCHAGLLPGCHTCIDSHHRHAVRRCHDAQAAAWLAPALAAAKQPQAQNKLPLDSPARCLALPRCSD